MTSMRKIDTRLRQERRMTATVTKLDTASGYDHAGGVRDYVGEMRQVCEKAVNDTELPNPIIAQRIVDELYEIDPGLLEGWLRVQATDVVRWHLNLIDHSARSTAAARTRPRAFQAARKRFDAGDADAFSGLFAARYVINDDKDRRRVADMTGRDHLFVATSYEVSSKRTAFLASVHRAVAARVGERRTSEVYSEEQYAAMFQAVA